MLPFLHVAQKKKTVFLCVLNFFLVLPFIYVFINYSWEKVRTASEEKSLIKQGARMWAWEWSRVGEGQLGEPEIQGMVAWVCVWAALYFWQVNVSSSPLMSDHVFRWGNEN